MGYFKTQVSFAKEPYKTDLYSDPVTKLSDLQESSRNVDTYSLAQPMGVPPLLTLPLHVNSPAEKVPWRGRKREREGERESACACERGRERERERETEREIVREREREREREKPFFPCCCMSTAPLKRCL